MVQPQFAKDIQKEFKALQKYANRIYFEVLNYKNRKMIEKKIGMSISSAKRILERTRIQQMNLQNPIYAKN